MIGTPATSTDEAHEEQPLSDSHGATELRSLLDNRWIILGILFGVMGVLGIPLLWASRGFRWPMKITLTLCVTLYTAGLAWWVYVSLINAYAEFQEFYSG